MAESYYDILEVDRTASQAEIKDAFRRLAKLYHPDKNRGSSNADEIRSKYMLIHKAYEVLSDPNSKQSYDKSGMAVEKGATIVDPLQAMMRMMEEKNTTGVPDVIVPISCTLKQLYDGYTQTVEFTRISACSKCKATGTKSKKLSNCETCTGRGILLTRIEGGEMGFSYKESMCDTCRGSTISPDVKRCTKCNGDKYIREDAECDINIPKGAYENYFVKIEAEGNYIPKENRINKQNRSDVLCVVADVSYEPYEPSDMADDNIDTDTDIIVPSYRRGIVIKELKRADRADLMIVISLSFVESICGISKKIRHLDGTIIELKVDDAVVNGDIIIVQQRGMPVLEDEKPNRKAKSLDTEFGDLLIRFEVKRPVLDRSIKRKLWQILSNTSYQNTLHMESPAVYMFLDNYIRDVMGSESESESKSEAKSESETDSASD